MKNRLIVVTGCFIDCPCSQEDNGGGFCEPFWKCEMMNKLIMDGNNYKVGKWNEKLTIHPDCPLYKTDMEKPSKQTYMVEGT